MTNTTAPTNSETKNGFYVAGDHSAIILYNLIAPELGLKIAIRKDSDFERRFLDGKVAIRNIDKHEEMLCDSKFVAGVTRNKDSLKQNNIL